jgi:predicted XRE-type DNA-binding protein
MATPSSEVSGRIVRSSGNVFADLGFADAGERQTKVRLAMAINNVLSRRELSQASAAKLRGINQPKVSALSKYRLEGFSVERLDAVPYIAQPGHRDCHSRQTTGSSARASICHGCVNPVSLRLPPSPQYPPC